MVFLLHRASRVGGCGIPGQTAAQLHSETEWLISDRTGRFAMGTPWGIRTRKYHGFCLGIAGREELSFLADLEIKLDGRPLWPHSFEKARPDHPEVARECFRGFRMEQGAAAWSWELPRGTLEFRILSRAVGELSLEWEWKAGVEGGPVLEMRPFLAFRSLHAMGGIRWQASQDSRGNWRAESAQGHRFDARAEGVLWEIEPHWYRDFHYERESERGYGATEDLFSHGVWRARLAKGCRCAIRMGEGSETGRKNAPAVHSPILDFALEKPEGVCAGYPWFGEWGRDTFISLPGIVAGWLRAGGDEAAVAVWAERVLTRWGGWIFSHGALPNLIGRDGPQWESADASLWWSHALCSLWAMGLAGVRSLEGIEERFVEPLEELVAAVEAGRHRFLKADGPSGLLEVSGPHATWMDARVEQRAVTPRMGALPEINALWFQARCLQFLVATRDRGAGNAPDPEKLRMLGQAALSCPSGTELERPNRIFLHSLPLAPSWVLSSVPRSKEAVREIDELVSQLGTPVGMRTLSRTNESYRPRYAGTQRERDESYHQGPVWGWLGGHLEMARWRAGAQNEIVFPPERIVRFPVPGHIPELFDPEEPFAWRGAPAQAWSLACWEEYLDRKRRRTDDAVSRILRRRMGEQAS